MELVAQRPSRPRHKRLRLHVARRCALVQLVHHIPLPPRGGVVRHRAPVVEVVARALEHLLHHVAHLSREHKLHAALVEPAVVRALAHEHVRPLRRLHRGIHHAHQRGHVLAVRRELRVELALAAQRLLPALPPAKVRARPPVADVHHRHHRSARGEGAEGARGDAHAVGNLHGEPLDGVLVVDRLHVLHVLGVRAEDVHEPQRGALRHGRLARGGGAVLLLFPAVRWATRSTSRRRTGPSPSTHTKGCMLFGRNAGEGVAHSSGETHRSSSARSVLQNALCHSLSVLSPKMRRCADPLFDILRQSRGATAGHVPSHLGRPGSRPRRNGTARRKAGSAARPSRRARRRTGTGRPRRFARTGERWRRASTGVTSSGGLASSSRRGWSLALEAMTPRDRSATRMRG